MDLGSQVVWWSWLCVCMVLWKSNQYCLFIGCFYFQPIVMQKLVISLFLAPFPIHFTAVISLDLDVVSLCMGVAFVCCGGVNVCLRCVIICHLTADSAFSFVAIKGLRTMKTEAHTTFFGLLKPIYATGNGTCRPSYLKPIAKHRP